VTSARTPRPRRVRVLSPILAGAAAAATLTLAASRWPAALLIRWLFWRGARETEAEMRPHAPTTGVVERTDIPYRPGGPKLDVFLPDTGATSLPVVVWTHGGAWISGQKKNVRPYLRMLAAQGFAAVGLDYSVAPGRTYPVAVTQLNDALAFLRREAATYGIDPERIVLAGDSAGANLTSQLALLTTDPSYARMVGLLPALSPRQLRGVVLACGIYDVRSIPTTPGIGGWGFRVALRAYLGRRDWSDTAGGREMSTLLHVSSAFPRTWISGGNADPLTGTQSRPFAARLEELSVPVTALFYADDHEPGLPHEYQFHLDFADARRAFDSLTDFLRDATR
jgi:acetyl esterase/lipase